MTHSTRDATMIKQFGSTDEVKEDPGWERELPGAPQWETGEPPTGSHTKVVVCSI